MIVLLAVHRDLADGTRNQEVKCVGWGSILPTKLVARATSLQRSKILLQIVHLQSKAKQSKTKEVFDEGAGYSLYATYTHSSTIHANWVKFGLVDVHFRRSRVRKCAENCNKFIFETSISILVISNHNSFRMLLDKVVPVYFIWKIYLYFSIGNGQPREPALCKLYRHFVPYSNVNYVYESMLATFW